MTQNNDDATGERERGLKVQFVGGEERKKKTKMKVSRTSQKGPAIRGAAHARSGFADVAEVALHDGDMIPRL